MSRGRFFGVCVNRVEPSCPISQVAIATRLAAASNTASTLMGVERESSSAASKTSDISDDCESLERFEELNARSCLPSIQQNKKNMDASISRAAAAAKLAAASANTASKQFVSRLILYSL